MQLIGMLDSPFVRRTAIAARLLGVPFTHRPISVFRGMAELSAINPVVKVPTWVADDGTALMDSTLIIDWLERLAGRRLAPDDGDARWRELRLQALALAACEKSVQLVYEGEMRPEARQHAPWLERVRGQQAAALRGLDELLVAAAPAATEAEVTNGALTAAVAWAFLHLRPATSVPAADYPALAAHAAALEALPVFRAAPPDERVVLA